MSTQSTAIERITGFACEVNEERWRELVKALDEWTETKARSGGMMRVITL